MSRYTKVALLIGTCVALVWVGAYAIHLFALIDEQIAHGLNFAKYPQQPVMQCISAIAGVIMAYGIAWTTIEISRGELKLLVGFLALIETLTLAWVFSLFKVYFSPIPAFLCGASSLALGVAYAQTEPGGRLTRLRQSLGRRVSRKTLTSVLNAPRTPLLDGELREVSVLVCQWFGQDAAGGQLKPEEWVEVHNRIGRIVSQITLPAGGYLDQSNGESIRVVFGAPLSDEQHASAACATAIDILKGIDLLNTTLVSEGSPAIDCRLGINSGVAVSGVLGGEAGHAYTVSGDAVNRAHRFCAANLIFGSRIVIGGRTVQLAEKTIESRPLELITGKKGEDLDEVHELLSLRDGLSPEEADRRQAFWTGVILYRSNRLDEALEQFVRARPNHGSVDLPVEFYVSRLENLRTPPRRLRPETVRHLNGI